MEIGKISRSGPPYSKEPTTIYLDGTQLAEREPAKVFRDLAEAF
jgi:hypothetical protein